MSLLPSVSATMVEPRRTVTWSRPPARSTTVSVNGTDFPELVIAVRSPWNRWRSSAPR